MLHRLYRKNKGQNTAEYALLIALVVAGVVAMQTYAQRSLQARVRDTSQYLAQSTSTAANGDIIGAAGQGAATDQYEPYYQASDYQVTRNSVENTRLGTGLVASDSSTNRARATGGSTSSQYGNGGELLGH